MTATVPSDLLFGRWSFRRVAFALFAGVFLLNAMGTGSLPLTNKDESRFAEAAREMRERGDWVVPHFNGEFRFDKPPLTYWCQVAAYSVFGENEFAARLHSVLAGALLAVVICWFGARLFHPEAGFWAAVIFSTGLRVMAQAKAATADMLLTLFVTLTFWAGWELLKNCVRQPENPHGSGVEARAPEPLAPQRGEGPGVRGGIDKKSDEIDPSSPPAPHIGWWWLFYVSLALAFLTKGPVGWLPLLALPLFARWTKTAALNRHFHFELGLPLMLGLVALWAAPAYVRTHGEYLRVGIGGHVIQRMTTGYDGQGSGSVWLYLLGLPYYVVMVFLSLAGWSWWFPWCFKQLRARLFGGPAERFLLSGILVFFVVFTLGWSRFGHYTMPVFPLIALLLAELWRRAARPWRPLTRVAASLVVVSFLITAGSTWIFPRLFPGRELARRCAPFLHPEYAFGVVDLDHPSLVWYFRHQVHDFQHQLKADEAAAFMAQPGPRLCVLKRDVAREQFPVLPAGWRLVDDPGPGYFAPSKEVFQLSVLIKP